ncbi:MAG: hypothetical protein BGO05_16640 [Rhizobiales bacterium 63-7]|nr:hypothetical protein [Hyphomicrobiales bacterium]OJU69042.1 MAG: hypothetical protein BGO05_16640 [Rhizobiales bacterium 63-7]
MEEIRKRYERIEQINSEIVALKPEFLASTRADIAIWADKLAPLFEEHHRLKTEIDALLASNG